MKYPTGIRPYHAGWRARVRVHPGMGGVKSATFPTSTPFRVMTEWRESQRILYHDEPEQFPIRKKAGFEQDAAEYLKAVAAMPSFSDRKRDIKAWVDVLGTADRARLTSADIQTHLSAWATQYAASTVNHRRTALMHLYRVLDGPNARNPVTSVPKFREPEPEPRGLSYGVIDAILSHMTESATKARLLVIAHTGIPHSSLARIRPEDVSLETRSVYVPGRSKGKGTRGRRLPLTDQGVSAFNALIRWDAFGPFSHSSLYKSFVLARNKADGDGCLKGIRPYDLRHSWGALVYARTGDIRATQILMGHSKAEMTHRYTSSALDARIAQAIARLSE